VPKVAMNVKTCPECESSWTIGLQCPECPDVRFCRNGLHVIEPGHTGRCPECTNHRAKRYYQDNREECLAKQRERDYRSGRRHRPVSAVPDAE
jgi:hypothetical protein